MEPRGAGGAPRPPRRAGYTAAQRMPARRPYASRGVPRPVTTYRSRGRPAAGRGAGSGPGGSSAAGLAALVVVLGLIGAGFVWVADPSVFGLPATLIQSVTRSNEPADPRPVAPRAADAPAPSGAGPVLQMAQVGPSTAATVDANATPTMVPTLRQWDSSPAGLVTDPTLVGRLDQALIGVDGHVSVAVKDLGSGRGAALDGDREMPAASLYKLPVLYSVFEAGLNMGEALPITDETRAYDAGTMELGVGEMLTVAEALERMVTISDNTSAVMLGSRVGAGRINANIAALGMDTTHYSLERMNTSALDMLHLLDVMATGNAVSPAASADMLHLLLRQRVNDRLPRLLPNDVQIAHKTGNLPGTVNDVGILYGPSSTVAIAVLISDTTDETMAATGVARVGQAAYEYFGDLAEVAGRPTIPRAPSRPIPPVWRQPNPPTPMPTPTPEPAPEPDKVPTEHAVVQPTPVPPRSGHRRPCRAPPHRRQRQPRPPPRHPRTWPRQLSTPAAPNPRSPTRPPAATATPQSRH